jgi:uncharacterized membrane protein
VSNNFFVALSNIFSGLLFILLSMPLVLGKVKMNHLYGIRISKAFKSDENWYRINRYGGKVLIAAGFVLIIAGTAELMYPVNNQNIVLFLAFLPAIILIPVLIIIFNYSNKLD